MTNTSAEKGAPECPENAGSFVDSLNQHTKNNQLIYLTNLI